MDLTELIDRFLYEYIEARNITLNRAARYHAYLVGVSYAPLLHIGYVRFLKSRGVDKPCIDDFNAHNIGRYWEFLMHHHGCRQANLGMKALRQFWVWAYASDYISDEKMPADLRWDGFEDLYPVHVTVEEKSPKRGGRNLI